MGRPGGGIAMPTLQSAAALEDYRAKILSARDPARPSIAVCAGAACGGLDSAAVAAAFSAEIKTQSAETKRRRPRKKQGQTRQRDAEELLPVEYQHPEEERRRREADG